MHVIVPAFNEAEGVAALLAAFQVVQPQLAPEWRMRLIPVDDGSRDETYSAIQAAAASTKGIEVRAIRLARNFGQQSAIQAGLETAFAESNRRDLFLLMDSDLQHPPAYIPEIIRRLESGIDHLQMVRDDADSAPFLKRLTSRMFYSVFRFFSGMDLPAGASDFRGMSFRFVEAYVRLQERGRFNRGLFYWLGFKREFFPYKCAERQYGQSQYGWRRMFRFGVVGLLQFSSKPLIVLCSVIAGLSILCCAAYFVYEAVRYWNGTQFVMGWPSLMFLVSFWSGSLAMSQLLIALYIDRLFEEIKGRPLYVIQEQWTKEDV